jgi:predicted transcriptional regulator
MSKQSSIRIPDELRQRIQNIAEQEDRSFSLQVVRLLRSALAQQAFSRQSDQHQQPQQAA